MLNRLAIGQVKRIGKVTVQYRVFTADCVRVVDDIANSEVIKKDEGSESSVVELLAELFLLLDNFYLGWPQGVD